MGGRAHSERDEWAEALKAYRAAAEADPKMSEAWYWISCAEFNLNGCKSCEAEYVPLMHCIKLDPNHVEAHNNLGEVFRYVRKDPAKAEKSYREAIRLDPKFAVARGNYSLLLLEQHPNRAVKKILEWFMVTCEKAGADAEELC